jgi:hypothetical protein
MSFAIIFQLSSAPWLLDVRKLLMLLHLIDPPVLTSIVAEDIEFHSFYLQWGDSYLA